MPSRPSRRATTGREASSSTPPPSSLTSASATITARIPLELEAQVRRLAKQMQMPASSFVRQSIDNEVHRRNHTIPPREFDLDDLAKMVEAQSNAIKTLRESVNDLAVAFQNVELRDRGSREILGRIAQALGVNIQSSGTTK